MKRDSWISKIGQFGIGVFLGTLAYAIPILLLYVALPSVSGDAAAGLATGLAIALPGILFVIVIFALLFQMAVTAWLAKKNSYVIVIGVWLIYPIIGLAVGGHHAHTKIQDYWASKEISTSRQLALPSKEVRKLVLSLRTAIFDKHGVGKAGKCGALCVALLKTGIVESVAVPRDEGFVINEFARGQTCKNAAENYQKNELARRSTPSNKRATYTQDMVANRRIQPETGRSSSTTVLASAGYFDECITIRFDQHYAYDIKIDFRREFREKNGLCCNIAEIFESTDGEDKLLGSWERGRGKFAYVNRFEISDITSKLTGKSVDHLVARRGKLKPYPIPSMEIELERLAGLLRNDAYIYSWAFFTGRAEKALRNARFGILPRPNENGRKSAREKLSISETTIGLLIEISSVAPIKSREGFFRRVGALLDEDSKDRLKVAIRRAETTARICSKGFEPRPARNSPCALPYANAASGGRVAMGGPGLPPSRHEPHAPGPRSSASFLPARIASAPTP